MRRHDLPIQKRKLLIPGNLLCFNSLLQNLSWSNNDTVDCYLLLIVYMVFFFVCLLPLEGKHKVKNVFVAH